MNMEIYLRARLRAPSITTIRARDQSRGVSARSARRVWSLFSREKSHRRREVWTAHSDAKAEKMDLSKFQYLIHFYLKNEKKI